MQIAWHSYRKILRISLRNLELINKFSKVEGCRINIQKLVAFLYTNNELPERERKQSFLQLHQEKKISRKKFNWGNKSPIHGNHDINKQNWRWHKWKDSTCSWIGTINIFKMSILLKAIYRFSGIPIKTPIAFFPKIGKIIPKFVWGFKKSWTAKTILRKKNKTGGYHVPWFQTTLQSYSNQNNMLLA